MTETNKSDSKINISNRMAMVILAAILAVAIAVFFFFQTKEPGNGETAQSPTSTATETTDSDSTNDSTGDDNSSPEAPADPEVTGAPEPRTAAPDPKGEAHNGGNHEVPPFVNGTEYVMTPEAVKVWHPIRAKFIKGLIGDGDIYKAVKGTGTEEVENKVKKLKPGQHKDSIPEHFDDHTVEQIYLGPYELTEGIKLSSGKKLTITISYVNISNTESKWLVTDYKIE